jgi:hypothetical protein
MASLLRPTFKCRPFSCRPQIVVTKQNGLQIIKRCTKSSQSPGYCLRSKILSKIENCLRKLKNFLISIFLNFLCQTAKKIALRAIVTLSARGGRSAVKNLKRLGRQCPRKTCPRKLAITTCV